MTLIWNASPGAVGYNVFYTTNKVSDPKDAQQTVFVKTNSMTLTNLAKGHYKVGVTTVYSNDVTSFPSWIDVRIR